MKLSRRLLIVAAFALVIAPTAGAGTVMFVGAAEDQARNVDPVEAKTQMDLAAPAGIDAVRMSSVGAPGEREASGNERTVQQSAAWGAQLAPPRRLLPVCPRTRRTPRS